MQTRTISVPEAGRRYFGVGRDKAYELARAGVIPAWRLGERKLVVSVDAIERVVTAQSAASAERVAMMLDGQGIRSTPAAAA